MKKLNFGCGKDLREDYINVDIADLKVLDPEKKFKGIYIKHDLNKYPYPFKDSEFDEIFSFGVVELLDNFVKAMEEMWRIGKKGAIIKITAPAFPSPASSWDLLTKHFVT
jgi:SAM-dependent methyltransferase